MAHDATVRAVSTSSCSSMILRATCLASLLGFAGGCGGGGAGQLPDAPEAPDAPSADGHELAITLFKHVPFVDGDTEPAAFVAVQDGDGAWTAVTAATAGQGAYHAHLASDRYGVAIGCRIGASTSVELFQRTAADGLDLRTASCGADTIELDVAVRNVPKASFAYVSAAGQSASGGGDATYAFHTRSGPAELFASLSDATGRMSRVVRVPPFDLEATQTVVIDFALQGALPEDRDLAVTLAAGEHAQVTTSVIRPTGAYVLSAGSAVGAPAKYQMVPAALQLPDDLFDVTVTSGSRSTTVTSKAPGALVVQLPAELTAPDPVMALKPVLHPVFSFATTTAQLPVQAYLLHARTSRMPDDVARDWSAELSAAWVGSAASAEYASPDLTAVTGFAPDLLLDPGPVRWSVRRTETTIGGGDGRITSSATRSGTIAMYCGDLVIQPPEACDPPDGATCSDTCTKL